MRTSIMAEPKAMLSPAPPQQCWLIGVCASADQCSAGESWCVDPPRLPSKTAAEARRAAHTEACPVDPVARLRCRTEVSTGTHCPGLPHTGHPGCRHIGVVHSDSGLSGVMKACWHAGAFLASDLRRAPTEPSLPLHWLCPHPPGHEPAAAYKSPFR